MTGPKETIYDEQISPLVKQINALCKKHGISAMSFFVLDTVEDEEHESYGEPLTCLTTLPDKDEDPEMAKRFRRAVAALRPQPVVMTSVTAGGITTVYDGPPSRVSRGSGEGSEG